MRVLVGGAGGALGGHLVKRLLDDGHEVRAVDIKPADDWWQADDRSSIWDYADLREFDICESAVSGVERVFNLAADMGGMGFIESHRADCMLSALINLNLLRASRAADIDRYWYASSACIYPQDKQREADRHVYLREVDAWPADPEPGYGWEKLYGELACFYAGEDWGFQTRIARLHNVYGPFSTYQGGREKAPAAICRKVAEAKLTGSEEIQIWGDGKQTRSFLYVDDFVEGALRIMDSDYGQPLNLGSEEVVTIDQLADLAEEAAGLEPQTFKRLYDLKAPQGVRGRGSDNMQLRRVVGWEPKVSLAEGMRELYAWVEQKVSESLAVKA